jgi:AraC-like DNA-binding protein
LSDAELVRRYEAKERIGELAAAAEMSRSGLYDRLKRLGVEPRTRGRQVSDAAIGAALERHGSIAAAAKALRVPRSRLMADAVRLGLRPPVATIPGDIEARYRQLGSLDAVAAAYEVDPTTAGRWLRALGVELRPGRRPRDT